MKRPARSRFLLSIAAFLALMLLLSPAPALSGPHAGNTSHVARAALGTMLVVTSTADGGPGSLRQALIDAAAGDTITFDTTVFPPAAPAAIMLQSELPQIYRGGITLDASNAGVVLDGRNIPEGYFRCLVITSNGNTVRGLQIVNCRYDGILLSNASDNSIGGDRSVGSGPVGQGNLISGNGGHGIQIHADSRNNRVLGNLVGVDLAGTGALPNNYAGIALQGSPGPSGNTIGGAAPGERNIVSGNRIEGIGLVEGAHDNVIVGNYIGADVTGAAALPNGTDGVHIGLGANHNRIGGATPAERNLIFSNGQAGVEIEESGLRL